MAKPTLHCPVCKVLLTQGEWPRQAQWHCNECALDFTCVNGIPNLIPFPPPDPEIKKLWQTWEKLQENGALSYETDPEHNLCVEKRPDATAFGRFCKLGGDVLDIGCGPQAQLPSYIPCKDLNFVGIDPLPGAPQRDYTMLHGIAEYLPFADNTFDHVLFATTLDHMLSPQKALSEAHRVVREKTGKVHIWIYDNTLKMSLADRALGRLNTIRQALFDKLGFATSKNTALDAGYKEKMDIPDGAEDEFHFFHPRRADVLQWLQDARLMLKREKQFQIYHLFLTACKA